ncbi:MAG: DUF192 domain-containing protein [Actinomycetes bacterium]|jgi:uncharacterized membrane protein (UPF0127 family)
MEPVWLVSKGNVLASADLATSRAERRRGLIGAGTVTTPLVLQPCNWVHSVGMRTAIDVAYVDADGNVIDVRCLRPFRVAPLNRRAVTVIEAAQGSFERWGLSCGDTVEIRRP